MKLFFYNDRLNDQSCQGSFSICSRELNFAAQELGYYGDAKNADFIIQMDAFLVDSKVSGKTCIPYLASEYNYSIKYLGDKIKQNNQLCLAISDQARNSLINSGAPSELVKTAHIGIKPQNFPNLNRRVRKIGDPLIYLTNNSSNNRSGYESSVPAFLEFAKGKNVKLIIKDQQNPRFQRLLQEIDTEKKITYIGNNLTHEKLVYLYNSAHFHLYLNSVTSFGMTPLESSCTGCCNILSKSSALLEYATDDFVTLVDCEDEEVNHLKIAEWNSWGLVINLPPLDKFPGKLIAPRPKYQSILEKLEYSYKHYSNLLAKNVKFQDTIRKEFTWRNSVQKIVEILKDI